MRFTNLIHPFQENKTKVLKLSKINAENKKNKLCPVNLELGLKKDLGVYRLQMASPSPAPELVRPDPLRG